MEQKFDKYVLKNGLVIIGEPMETVESVAFGFLLPSGAAVMPQGLCGAANVIEDWIFRGAGSRDSRQLSDELDGLGLHRATSVSSSHLTAGAGLEASNLEASIELYADVLLRPLLLDEQFEPARQLAIDGLKGLDDDPREKVTLKLRELFYPYPLGRSTVGEMDELKALTTEQTREIVKKNFNLSGTVFTIAGKYDFDKVCKQLERLFETGRKKPAKSIKIGKKTDKYVHIQNEGAQVHIGLMIETVKVDDKDYYNARAAVSVLSGGMSARLFTEVREKRGLCYSVGARYHALKEAAGIGCYAGTTPDKAQQTLDVIIGEFNRLAEGISNEEIQRAKTGLKSGLILQSESTSSRAGAIAGDYYILGRVRSLEEIKEQIEQTTVESVLEFLRAHPFKDFTVVTIGPKGVKVG